MGKLFFEQKNDIAKNNDDYNQDMPKDSLAQKRNMLEVMEEIPKPFFDLDEKDSEELKKSKLDYKTLGVNQKLKEMRKNPSGSDKIPFLPNKPRF